MTIAIRKFTEGCYCERNNFGEIWMNPETRARKERLVYDGEKLIGVLLREDGSWWADIDGLPGLEIPDLRNLEAAEARLMEIMEEARQTEDVLAVFQQLSQVQEQIEVTKGRIQYYEQSAAMSSISVELLANAAVQPISVGGWQPVGVARQALQSLVSALQVLADIVIYFVLLVLPVMVLVLLPPGLILWGILRWRARRKAAKVKDASTPVK